MKVILKCDKLKYNIKKINWKINLKLTYLSMHIHNLYYNLDLGGFMVKNLNIVIYKKSRLRLFIIDKILFMNKNFNMEVIDRNVLDYSIEYDENFLWFCYYNDRQELFIGEVDLNNETAAKVKTNILFSFKEKLKRVDSLRVIIINSKEVQILFRGWDKYNDKIYIFQSNVFKANTLNKIPISNPMDYNSSFRISTIDNKVFMLLCHNFENGEYGLYDLFNNNNMIDFTLPYINNLSFINHNKKPAIFYNKLVQKDLSISYREIAVTNNNAYLQEENRLPLPKNILKPRISVYQGKIYVIWNNSNSLNIALSSDLKQWKVSSLSKQSTQNMIKATIIKVINNKCEKIKAYINFSDLQQLVKNFLNNENSNKDSFHNLKNFNNINRENAIRSNFKEELSKIGWINSQFEYLDKISDIEERYEAICRDYLDTINYLRNTIEEKDKIILKLLNI